MTARLPDFRPLRGEAVVLDAYRTEDAEALFAALDDARVWAAGYGGGPAGRPSTAADFGAQFAARVCAGHAIYVVRLATDGPLGTAGTVVGTSTLGEADPRHERIHLGWTAYAPAVWGTAVNSECKLLLLRHAFEDCGFERVKLQADSSNTRSRAAILGLGATFEGVLRHHMVRPDGTRRDTAVYSVLAAEWPAVADRLVRRLAAAAG